MKVCPDCGGDNQPDARACRWCGSGFGPPVARAQEPPRPDLAPSQTGPMAPRPDFAAYGYGFKPPSGPPRAAGRFPMAVTWGFWESLLLGMAGFLIGGIVLAIPIAVTTTNGELTDTQFALVAVLGEVGVFATVVAWLRIRHHATWRALAVDTKRPVDALIGFGCGLGLYLVAVVGIATVLSLLLDRIAGHPIEAPDQLPTTLSGTALWLTGVAVVVCAPIAEELLFRGMLFRSIRDRHGFWPGALVSSALFGLVHWQGSPWESSILLVGTLAFVGFGLALLYEWRRNLLTNIAAHCAFNVVGFVFFVTTSTNGTAFLR